jgi:hypothetical protein
MMKISMGAVLVLALAGFAGSASARPIYSQSVKYFDESGAIVGQQYLLCDGRSGHGGNTHTAYTVTEQTTCNGGEPPEWIVPNLIVTAYTLPGSVSIATACSVGRCEGQYVPEVQILGMWPYTPGFQ